MMLGVLVIVMATAQVSHQKNLDAEETARQLQAVEEDSELVYQRILASQLLRGLTLVYAETAKGPNFDRCFLLTDDGKPGKEIPLVATKHPSDIPEIAPGMTVVVLISGAGFDSRWTRKRIAEIESTFEIRVIPLYNIDLRM